MDFLFMQILGDFFHLVLRSFLVHLLSQTFTDQTHQIQNKTWTVFQT